MNAETLRCLEVAATTEGPGAQNLAATVVTRPRAAPPAGEVLLRVHWSALNYKDALAATGHPGVVRRFPHVPGIDAAGEVVASDSPLWPVGAQAIVTSYDLGVGRDGGWSEYVAAPADWLVPLPDGLSHYEAMILGTAGLTAALAVETLRQHGISPQDGEILVTGASGGVGSLAVRLLASLGYHVVAATGKPTLTGQLLAWGAQEVVSRAAVVDASPKPLLKARWAGVVDCVGGATLTTAVRQMQPRGCVAACGLVGGADIALTVYPFLLRGVTLAGVDSAFCPADRRRRMWDLLAGEWRIPRLEEAVTVVSLDELAPHISAILNGEVAGRVVVRLAG